MVGGKSMAAARPGLEAKWDEPGRSRIRSQAIYSAKGGNGANMQIGIAPVNRGLKLRTKDAPAAESCREREDGTRRQGRGRVRRSLKAECGW
jgi:hypothetical protein